MRAFRLRSMVAGMVMVSALASAAASGPRYVTGPPFFAGTAGLAVGWKQTNLMYFTDPGDLGPAVNHATADAMVAAAAGIWNVSVASITVGQGGSLAQHVSGQNTYLSSDGMVWPADVMSANAAAVPVAIVYDSDGSVTETLLGAGASDPSGCEQNAVTESVDRFDPAGYIVHAIVVLNGRCTGTAPEKQLQMQYQLERVFGRVLGLAWSQLNDNVYTGTPTATYDQVKHWPLMHPLDILCGPYSYQCMPNAFALTPDDVAGLVGVYPVVKNAPAGKQVSLSAANSLNGTITFPSGEGMAGVNVLVKRGLRFSTEQDDWYESSAVSGSYFQRTGKSPFVAAGTGAANSQGTTTAARQGFYYVPYFAIGYTSGQQEFVSLEPVNPLYIGSASVGPYVPGMVSEAGRSPAPYTWQTVGNGSGLTSNFAIPDAPSGCGDGSDGTASAPMAAPASGWWNGLLCGYGHTSYAAVNVRAGRSLTVEVTALDQNGFATTTKAMPVIGLYAPTDGAAALPSLAVQAGAFNGLGIGTTTLNDAPFPAPGAGGTVRIGVADQRGDGRPDFAYQARLFYADSVSPAAVSVGGAMVTITGMGFRAGNAVSVNGVAAKVTSWNATQIVLTAPSTAIAGAAIGVPVDVEVSDLGTGATSVMSGALTYGAGAPANMLQVVTAPAGTMYVGDMTATPFAVQVLASDGVTPVAGSTVAFSATAGKVQCAACGASVCNVVTDTNGMASTQLTPTGAGTVSVQAANGAATVSASFIAETKAGSMLMVSAPSGNVAVGVVATPVFAVQVLAGDGKTGMPGQLISFTVAAGSAVFSGCNGATCSAVTDSSGKAQMSVTPTAAGTVTLAATDGSLAQQASFTATAYANQLVVTSVPSASAPPKKNAGNFAVKLLKGDGVTPVVGAPVVFSIPPGVQFGGCLTAICTIQTASDGTAGTYVVGVTPGTYLLQASYGPATASTGFQVTSTAPFQLSILSAPSGSVPVGAAAAVPFSIRLKNGDGTPAVGYSLVLGATEGMATLSCRYQPCVFITDGTGTATTSVTPVMPGLVSLSATFYNLTATAAFIATGAQESLKFVSPPPPSVTVGDKVNFTMEVTGPDGVTPVPNQSIWFAVTSGVLGFNGCAAGNCRASTGATGVVAITALTSVPGTVTLVANSAALAPVQVTFVVAAKTYAMSTVTAPSGSYWEGTPVSPPFVVQLLGADGVTPASGQNVTFSMSGAATLAACKVLPCVVKTGKTGMASTGTITSTGPGPVTVTATNNANVQTASFTVMPNVMSVTPLESQTYVAEGATVALQLDATVSEDGGPVVSQAITWTGGAGLSVSKASTATDKNGHASVQASAGPLAAGLSATATACAWTSVCGQFQATGVGADALRIAVASGGLQAVSGAALQPVIAQVTDGQGNPVAGASVAIGQTVRALDVSCPVLGRCPAAPVLESGTGTAVSDLNGNISVTPMLLPGVATTTAMEFSTGTQGFATAVVSHTP